MRRVSWCLLGSGDVDVDMGFYFRFCMATACSGVEYVSLFLLTMLVVWDAGLSSPLGVEVRML